MKMFLYPISEIGNTLKNYISIRSFLFFHDPPYRLKVGGDRRTVTVKMSTIQINCDEMDKNKHKISFQTF